LFAGFYNGLPYDKYILNGRNKNKKEKNVDILIHRGNPVRESGNIFGAI
jgi:hypothetical protein